MIFSLSYSFLPDNFSDDDFDELEENESPAEEDEDFGLYDEFSEE